MGIGLNNVTLGNERVPSWRVWFHHKFASGNATVRLLKVEKVASVRVPEVKLLY